MENKKDNFKRISTNRTDKILNLLKQLTNLTNTSFYEYTEDEIKEMFELIEKETEISKKILLKNIDKKSKRIVL